jgi:hypothetical protein
MQLRTVLGAVAALTMTAFAGLGVASPALADTYGPQSGASQVSATSVHKGGKVTVTGSGFRSHSIVTLTASQGGRVYISQTARASGGAGVAFGQSLAASPGSVRFTVKLTRSGTNTIKMIGTQFDGTGILLLTAPRVHVSGAVSGINAGNANTGSANTGSTNSASGLPGTGGVNFTPLWAGLGLLAAGALLVTGARSRRRILV